MVPEPAVAAGGLVAFDGVVVVVDLWAQQASPWPRRSIWQPAPTTAGRTRAVAHPLPGRANGVRDESSNRVHLIGRRVVGRQQRAADNRRRIGAGSPLPQWMRSWPRHPSGALMAFVIDADVGATKLPPSTDWTLAADGNPQKSAALVSELRCSRRRHRHAGHFPVASRRQLRLMFRLFAGRLPGLTGRYPSGLQRMRHHR